MIALDIVGFSAMMNVDELGTLRRIQAFQRLIVSPAVEENRGRVFKIIGDGALADFRSVHDAFAAARGILENLHGSDLGLQVRIGLHIGDLIFDDGDVFGDGVNIAARLEGIARPGSIAVSERAFSELGKAHENFEDLGKISLKNIKEPVRVYLFGNLSRDRTRILRVARRMLGRRSVVIGGTALALSGGWLALSKGGFLSPAPAPERSVAVLPFANLSRDPDQRYFSDGLTSEIRSQLSRNALLQIVGPTSSEEFREFSGDARKIARELDVAFLLGGNVQRAADKVKVAVDLTDGKSGISKWAETFERPLADIFAIQNEIASRVVSQLAAAMDDRAPATATGASGGTDSVAAFDAYLRGRDLYEAGIDEASDRQALAKFDEAIAFDPKYAGAYAARSRSLAIIGNLYANHEERVTVYDGALVSAKRATQLAANFAEGFSALGFAFASGQLDMRSARKPFAKSYELGKGDADILSRYATFQSHLRDHATATQLIRDALTLDPINPRAYRSLGDISLSGRQYDKAIVAYRKAGSLNPTLGGLNNSIGSAQYLLGRLDEAYASFAREKRSVRRLPGLAMIDGRRGNRARAEAALAALVAEYGEKSNYQYAQVYAQWGESAKALKALEAAKELRDGGIMLMYADPLLDPIRETDGYNNLVKIAGFE